MTIFDVLTFIGGLALFLYGMQVMGEGLEKRAGNKMRATLEKLTSSTLRGVILGAGVTAIIQSSSATTVMVVGFVNSGVMKLEQTVGIIMGANIGTTVTAWLLSLTGLESSDMVIQLFKPSSFAPVVAAIGIILYMFSKRERRRDIGMILLGFSVLIFGMGFMSGSVESLSDSPAFLNLLTLFSNPLLGMLAGIAITAIIQSSSASVGILQALSVTGSISFGTAIPILMGSSVGTCITALLSGIGATKNAKRAALVHLYFNLIGSLVFMALFIILRAVVDIPLLTETIDPASIALVYSIYSIARTVVLLPFAKQLEHLAYISIKDADERRDPVYLDPRLLAAPSIAIQRCRQLTIDMAHLCQTTLNQALSLTEKFDDHTVQQVLDGEELTDTYEDRIGSYLMEISGKSISEDDAHRVAELLHCIGDFERIGDHALNISECAQEMNDKQLDFSPKARSQLHVIQTAVTDILSMAINAFIEDNIELAKQVEPLEEVVDYLRMQLKTEHVKRLQRGDCTIEQGFVFSDILTNFERISDHCSNIGGSVIQSSLSELEMHKYLTNMKNPDNKEFSDMYNKFLMRFVLPLADISDDAQ